MSRDAPAVQLLRSAAFGSALLNLAAQSLRDPRRKPKMQTSRYMRLAAIGLTSLLLASPTLGAEIKKEEGTLPSQFPYMINVPENWNGIVINDLDAVANKDGKFAAYLLDHGYAYTGTGRHPERMTRHDPLTELDAQVAVIKMVKEKYGQP